MNEMIREQILAIKDTGLTNMFDKLAVQRLAIERGYIELVSFLEENTKAYVRFILSGESEKQSDAAFVRKAYTLGDLIAWDKAAKQRSKFIIEKTILLSALEYKEFCNNLLSNRDFVEENISQMHMDENRTQHCILVKEEGRSEGILIQSEGYSYPRYTAYYKE